MGKNSKSDKQKVKFSSKTKFLPKGRNVTNTTFKIKPINIVTQLKETTIRRNISISDLITKLNHSNYNKKIEACEELCHAISHAPEIVRPWVLLLVQGVIVHVQDRERKVRRACINVIDTTLKTFPHKYNAIFNVMSANLRCAMTNIDKAIQEDSLLLIDSFLNHVPSLIAEDFKKIFRDFLTLTSKLKSNSNVDRTLTVNLNSKLTTVRWRIKVLSQLYGILNIVIKKLKTANAVDKPLVIDATANNYLVPLYKNCNFEYSAVDYFNKSSDDEDNNSVLSKNVNILISLLYETWLEVVPEKSMKKVRNETTILNKEVSTILDCIVNILYLLYEYSQTSRTVGLFISSKEWELLLNYLLDNFPYIQNEKSQTSSLKKDDISSLFTVNEDNKCVQQNLLICLFYFMKNTEKSGKMQFKILSAYINKCLLTENYMTSSNTKYLLIILEKILLQEPKLWLDKGLNLDEILQNLITFYNHKGVNEEHKCQILCLLIKAANIPLLNRCSEYQKWFEQLPLLLCKEEITDKVVMKLLQLSKEKNRVFDENLQKNLTNILNNLPTIKIGCSSNIDVVKMNIAYIFYYVSYLLTNEDVDSIRYFVNSKEDLVYSKYFANVISD